MRSQRHCEAFLHFAFWVYCLALHHHQGTGTNPALGVMIATHDSDLIVQSAGRGWHSQATPMHRKMNRVCHAIARAHIGVAMAMHMFTRPLPLMCTCPLSALVNCPGIVCPRERSRYKTDTRKNEDGNVTRNICVNSVVCLPNFCFVKCQEHHSHVSNKMSISLLAACVDMSGTFKVAVSFASTFQCASRTNFLKDHVEPFAVEWCQRFSKNNCMLTPRTTRGNWRKKKKKRSSARKS